LSGLLDGYDETLQSWRKLPSPTPGANWDDDEPPASDILAARLRAKFYGAQYISTRPYLDYAIHVMQDVKRGISLDRITVDGAGATRPSELALFRAIANMSFHKVQEKARTCIKAAINSTISLDRVPDRLVVTNIMGTAHA